jgi:hypothetical protein
MATFIGMVPAYADDATGDVFVNPNEISGAGDDDDSGFLGLGREARLRRIDRRQERLGRREARIRGRMGVEDDEQETPADIYQAAAAAGMVNENQFNGLGAVVLLASGAGNLSDTVNRNLWGKSLVLDSDDPASITVTAISIAGLPINVGAKGTPLSMFKHDSTRFGISFGRKLGLVGQTILVQLQNIDAGSGHTVSGGIICDELNPYAMQRWMEQMLLEAAVMGFQS